MGPVFVGLGSNIGDRLQYLQRAVRAISGIEGISVGTASSVYETEPVGKKDQPSFLNAVLRLNASSDPFALLSQLKRIENVVGRSGTERWGPREIDLDLLYYHDVILDSPSLVLPHPGIATRKFVLIPLVEIAAEFIDPVSHCSLQELLLRCPDGSSVVKTPSALFPIPLEN